MELITLAKSTNRTVDSATGTNTVNAVNDAPTTDDIATTIDENRVASRSTGITLQGSDIDGDDNILYCKRTI